MIEAKASSARADVRMAIGQLLDYRRHVAGVKRCVLLVPDRPGEDLLELIAGVGFGVVYRSGKSFESVEGQLY